MTMRNVSLDSSLILLSVFVFSVSRILPDSLLPSGIAIVLLLTAAVVFRCPAATHLALFCFLLTALPLASPFLDGWPGALLAPLALYYLLALSIPGLRKSHMWPGLGRIGEAGKVLMFITILGAALALVVWHRLARPDLAPYLDPVKKLSTLLLPLAGIGFALVNAVMEELAFRGIFQTAAGRVFQNEAAAIALQALPFGCLHYVGGFPNGVAGVLMTFIYGMLLGFMRSRSRGMAAPVLTHFFADLTIFVILVAVI